MNKDFQRPEDYINPDTCIEPIFDGLAELDRYGALDHVIKWYKEKKAKMTDDELWDRAQRSILRNDDDIPF
jgi:hypothetical protein